MAQDIVKALTPVAGKFEKHDEHFESDRFVVTSAVGHLLEIQAPEEFDVKRGKWSFAHLPVIPPYFDLKPVDRTKTRLAAVVRQAKRPDVTELVNACDAGREGELIFRLILQYAERQEAAEQAGPPAVAPVDDAAGDPRRVRRAAQRRADARAGRRRALPLRGRLARRHQRHASDDGLQLARWRFLPHDGRARADADARHRRRARGEDQEVRQPRSTGRSTRRFSPRPASITGKWFDPRWKKSDEDAELRADRVWSLREAQAIADAVRGKPATVTEESKPTTQASPVLFDLTSLQREANGRFGFSAKTTLSIAQSLYERHKALTYPRTDSRALPEDYLPVVRQTFEMLAKSGMAHLRHTPAPPSTATTSSRPSASSTTQRSAITSRSFRRSSRRTACRKPSRSSTTSSRGASWRSSFPRRNTSSRRASPWPRATASRARARCSSAPGWLAIYGKEAQDEGSKDAPSLVAREAR